MTEPSVALPATRTDPALDELVDEFAQKLQSDAPESVDEFARRHPEYADKLLHILPAMQVLAGFGSTHGATDPSMAKTLGTLGDFRIVAEIGRGGMGVVYEAEQISLSRRVALKVLPFASTLDPKQLQRFKNEAQAAAGLHHQNIVPVHATGCERGVHYYAMQFIEGHTLAEVILDLRLQSANIKKHGQISSAIPQSTVNILKSSTFLSTQGRPFYDAVARLGIQAAEALDYSHDLGIIHRDIKPANMLVDDHSKLWITDFGLAYCQSQAGLTMTGDLVGTLRYMSPEQALAKRVAVDQRTDIYSLGATLYELVCGEPVFSGDDRQELLRQIGFEEPQSLRGHNKAIPAELETIIFKALEKNPADRYATGKEMGEDLARFVNDEPIRARRPSLARRMRGWGHRHRALVWSVTVALVATGTALAGAVGWVARDAAVRQAVVEAEVRRALKEVQRVQEQAKWPQALEIARQTQTLAESGSGDEILRQQVRDRVNDLRMMVQLEVIRLSIRNNEGATSNFNPATDAEIGRAESAYRRAFQEHGLDVDALPSQEAAAIIQAKSVKVELALALDAWARVRRGDNKNKRDWKRLNAVAGAADPEPWRNRFRQAWASLDNKERTAELEKLASAAKVEELLPDSISLLATALGEANRTEQAITLLRTAQRRYSSNFWINQNLAFFLANASSPRNDEAIRYYFASIAARPDYPVSRVDLGISLHKKGEIDEAIVCYREAIRLKPDYANAHSQLGNALSLKGKFAEAEANCRQAIEIEPDNYFTHQTLGDVLIDQQKYTEAEAAFRKAIEIKPDFWVPHLGLGDALRQQGKFAEALTALKKAQELGSGKEGWQPTDDALVGLVELFALLDPKLPRILINEISPADASERLALARLCQLACRQNYGAAVRFYSEAFVANPKLADDMKIQYRYSAACAAALAGCGQGKDAPHLEARDLAHFRGQALSWLRADLDAWDARLKTDFAKEAAKVRQVLLHWQQDADFNGVRAAEALAKLPDMERREWQKLWDEVARLERRASAKK